MHLASSDLKPDTQNRHVGLLILDRATAWFVLRTFFTISVVKLGIVVEDAVSGPIGTAFSLNEGHP